MNSVVAIDMKALGSSYTVNLVFGVGVRFHFNKHLDLTGGGFAMGFGKPTTAQVKQLWNKLDFSGTYSQGLSD
jgi:hypothetical protein